MSDIIKFATGNELQEIIAGSNKMVSGMTTQEAANALKLVGTEGKMVTGPATLKPNTNVIEFPNSSASEAITEYVNQGGQLSSSNSATVSTTTSSANLTVGKTATGATTVLGVLSMPLPTVAAAVAPLFGVALGAGLYKLAPEFWTKISQKLLPSCWKDTEVMPAVISENGQVYLSKQAIDSLSEIMEEVKSTNVKTSSLDFGGYITSLIATQTVKCVDPRYPDTIHTFKASDFGAEVMACWVEETAVRNGLLVNYASKTSNDKLIYSYTYDGKTVYYTTSVNLYRASLRPELVSPNSYPGGVVPKGQSDGGHIAWTLIYGEGGLAEPGVNLWEGNVPVDYTQGAIEVLTDPSGNTEPYYPVYVPAGDPGVSADPAVRPNPTAPVEFPEIGTYIPPVVKPSTYPLEIPVPDETARTSPLETYVPNLNVNLDPNADPSAEPAPDPAPEPAPDPYPDLKPPSSGGISPPIVFPLPGNFPSIVPASGSGLIHVYNPTPEEMISFGNWLWVTYADASLQKIWNNPFDGVISAHELYATPSNDGRDNIRSGFLVCPTTAALVRQRYTTIDCGSMVVPEYYGNYLDYAPYSKAHVYLPFIGIVELDVDDIVGHGVNITYHIDSYNGSCIAQITVAKNDYQNTVYQFSGNCSVEIPLAGGSQAAIKSGMISAAATGISSIVGGLASMLGGNIGGGIGGIAYGIGGAISQAVSQKSSVQHSGTFGASYGAMGIKKPYFIIHRPIQKMVVNYNEDYGFPAHKRVRIGNCKGFLRVREVHAASATATDEEKARIEELLKEGVFVS